MDRAFTQERLAKTRQQIIAYEEAIDALVTGGVNSYELDTGMSRTKVSKLDVDKMQDALDRLLNRAATLEARLNGGSITVRPGY